MSDLEEYLEGTDPRDPADRLRVSSVSKTATSGAVTFSLTFASSASRLYEIEISSSLLSPNWTDSGLGIFAPDSNTTTRQISSTVTSRFFRVRAVRLGF